jgi:hypothetical protein
MLYTFETHIHTAEGSLCSKAKAADCVARCIALGYDGMVVTDHIGRYHRAKFETEKHLDGSWKTYIDAILQGYANARAAAPGGFSVLLGGECQFNSSPNDYLVYGLTEDFLYQHEDFFEPREKAFYETYAEAYNLFIVQAHPFRKGMRVVDVKYLDGMEVYNGNRNHDSSNAFAALWAASHGLKALSGSDYHGGKSGERVVPGGVCFPSKPETQDELVRLLRGNFAMLGACETSLKSTW